MLQVRHRSWVWALGVLFWGCHFASPFADAQGRVILQPRGAQLPFNDGSEAAPSFITNRELSRRLRAAQEFFGQSDYRTGVRYIQSILDEKEDWFLERTQAELAPGDPKNAKTAERRSHFSSLKHAAENLIAKLPEAGRKAYEQEVGIEAGVLLKQAAAESDEDKLNEIARRFFHTDAGYEAVYRLGLMHADHGEPFAAALHFQRLKSNPRASARFEPMLSLKLAVCWERAGLPNQSLAALSELRRRSPKGRVRLGGKEIELVQGTDRLAEALRNQSEGGFGQSEQWTNFRGNLSRSATSSPASPVGPIAWSHSTLGGGDSFGPTRGQLARIEKSLAELAEARQSDKRLLPVPAAQPLIVNNAAVFRTLRNIKAVDLGSGDLLWESAHTDEMLRPVLSQPQVPPGAIGGNGMLPNGNASNQRSALETYLVQRKWRDMTTGAISSDGARVYSIEEVGLADGLYFANSYESDPFLPQSHNKLIAYSAKDGFTEWEAGGEMIDKDDAVGGTFFLGAPLAIGGHLFCLGERKNEIRLMVLDAPTGRLVWEQRLVSPKLSLMENRERRTMGLSPAFGHGVMICPTASGAVVAVDISRRMLLWAYEYESTMTEDFLVANMAWQRGRNLQFGHESIHPEARWADSVPVVANGKVLITPSDSQEIHCLNLSSGAAEWTRPRGESVYLAGVWNDQALVIGRSQVRAVQLSDGNDVWTSPVSIPLPAGRGFLAGNSYHLPLSTGEIATIDLKQGKLTARSRVPGATSLGNLVSAGGRVVFQSLDSAGAFLAWDRLQTDLAAKLRSNPNDAHSLAVRGRLRLHQGDAKGALVDLQQSFESQPMEDVRRQLVELLLENLRTRPAEFQAQRDTLRGLIRTSEESLQFLMLSASQADTADARATAFRDYVKLAQTLGGEPEMHRIEPGHSARGDRWIRARIDELARSASPEELKGWDKVVREELNGKLAELPTETRLRILSALPRLPAVESARLAIAQDWPTATSLEKTRLLKSLVESSDAKTRDSARLALAETYLELLRSEEAYPHIEKLGEKWPAEWRAKFKDLEPPEDVVWPSQKLKAAFQIRRVAVLPEIPVEVAGINDSPYEGWSFSIDQQSRRLLAKDKNGREGWHLDLAETKGPILNFSGITITIEGHLALLSFGTHFAVLDLIKREHTASVIGSAMLMDDPDDIDELLRMQRFQRNQAFGGVIPGLDNGKPELLGPDILVYQIGERLTAADPLSGEPLWTREGLPANSRIIGDFQHVVLLSASRRSANVYRTTDGGQVNVVALPERQEQVAYEGTDLIHWSKAGLERKLVCLSLASGKNRWQVDCEAGASHRRVDGNHLAILEAGGRFRIISLADGRAVVDAKTDPDPLRKSFHVASLASRFLLFTSRSEDPAAPAMGRNPFQLETDAQPVDGPAYAYDAETGKLLWKTAIENQALEKLPPYNSPVLIFNKRRLPGQAIGGFGQNNYLVRVLDLRTGEMIYEHNRLQNVSPWSVRIQPTQRTLTITFYEGVIEIEFTKAPLQSS